jgi:hypothetical protein
MFAKSRSAATWTAVTLAAALCAALSATPGPAVPDPQVAQQGRPVQAAPVSPPTGTSTVTITVATDDGFAVKNARVVLIAIPGGAAATRGSVPGQAPVADLQIARDRGGRGSVVQKQLRTNAGGQATFTDLPDGNYSFSVMPPPGYVWGVREAVPRVQVKAGGRAAATVKLTRGGVITGRVVDDEGDPVTGAYVSLFRATKGGRPQSAGAPSQPTNDLGVYRVWSLAAGDYYVSTHFEDRQGPPDEAVVQDGYLPTYFPGAAAFDAARAVQVKGGQETGGVDIQLVRGRLGSVTVRVVDSFGSAAGPSGPNANFNANVSLVARSRNPAYQGRGAGMRQDGTFLLSNVPAGDYYVSAMLVRGSGPTAYREGGYLPVSVNGDEVSVSIQTNMGATISGRVVIEGTPPAQAGTPGGVGRQAAAIRVMATSAADGGFASAFSTGDTSGTSGPSGSVRPDGTFVLSGVRGPVQLVGTAARAAFKSVRRGASDITGQPFELLGTERVDDVVVVMTYDTGGIQGTVVGESDEVLSNAAVLIVPDDPDRWTPGSPFIRTVRAMAGTPGGQGAAAAAMPGMTTGVQASGEGGTAFQASLLPPGRYLVIGFADAASLGAQPDRQSIEAWREFGTTAIVDVGQTAVVKVRAIR